MTISRDPSTVVVLKDAPTKAGVAGLEHKAVAGSGRHRDRLASYSTAETSAKLRNEAIIGVLVLATILIAIYVFFFVVL